MQTRAVLEREASEEAFQCLLLMFSKVVKVLEAFLVGDVGEDSLCVGEMLVDVVEVCHQYLAPSPEVVDCLSIVCSEHFLHDAIELVDVLQRVGNLYGSERQEEVGHCAVMRCPYRFVAQQGKLTVQEHSGTLAWEDNRDIAHVVSEVRQHVGCNDIEETLHWLSCEL